MSAFRAADQGLKMARFWAYSSVNDDESSLYYLQSRYYDPTLGRFINADTFASTGHGVLGYNMFAYCNNNPIVYTDTSGTSLHPSQAYYNDGSRGNFGQFTAGAVAVGSIVLGMKELAQSAATYLSNTYSKVKKEVYDYAKSLIDATASMYDNKQPRIHHIVPQGNFSNRSRETQRKVFEMQQILTDVGIDYRNDPQNLLILSHGYHKSLHTDEYISYIHSCLEGAKGSKEAVEAVLFSLRIIIASGDPYANNY